MTAFSFTRKGQAFNDSGSVALDGMESVELQRRLGEPQANSIMGKAC